MIALKERQLLLCCYLQTVVACASKVL